MASPYLQLLRLTSPEAIITLTALIILALGLAESRGTAVAGVSTRPRNSGSEPAGAAAFSSFIAILGIAFAVVTLIRLPRYAVLFNGMIVISPLTSFFKIICLVLVFFTVLLAQSEKSLRNHAEYLAILLFAAVGLMLLVGSEELLTIFIGLELLGLSLYVLTAFDKTDLHGAEAGLKYFLFGSTASAFTLFGISLVYGIAGATDLGSIATNLSALPKPQPLLTAGVIMTLIGFAFKIAAAPFHLWAPDAYQGGPIPSAAFIASASKVASFVVLGKIMIIGLAPLQGQAEWHRMVAGWSPLLAVLAAASILLGNFVALAQRNVRRLLAYSAVAHAGYTLLGLVAGGRDGFSATLFYTTAYAFTLIGAFGVCAIVRSQTGGDDLSNFAGIWAKSGQSTGLRAAAAAMVCFMLSLAGLPPLAGFFGKFYLFSTVIAAGNNHGLLWLVVVALFGSLVSLYYYLMVLKVIFVQPRTGEVGSSWSAQPELLRPVVVSVLALLVMFLGLAPATLVDRIFAALA